MSSFYSLFSFIFLHNFRCLLGNDLVALVGMLVQMYIQLYAPYEVSDSHTMCVFRVIWRWFGLASGCVATVMAFERYFAITRPFFYQTVNKIFFFLLHNSVSETESNFIHVIQDAFDLIVFQPHDSRNRIRLTSRYN